jgi:hypothetical protein
MDLAGNMVDVCVGEARDVKPFEGHIDQCSRFGTELRLEIFGGKVIKCAAKLFCEYMTAPYACKCSKN